MFFPEGQLRVHLYGQPCDMRRSLDGLQGMVRHELGVDPLDGSLYCFINRRATQMRVLYFDRSVFCIWAKRLEAGRFISDWSRVCTRQMDFTALKMLLEGIEPARVRKRYRLPQARQDSPSKSSSNSHALLQLRDATDGAHDGSANDRRLIFSLGVAFLSLGRWGDTYVLPGSHWGAEVIWWTGVLALLV